MRGHINEGGFYPLFIGEKMFYYKDENDAVFFISKYTIEYNEDAHTYSVYLYEHEWGENGKEYFQVDDKEFSTYDEVLNFLKEGQ